MVQQLHHDNKVPIKLVSGSLAVVSVYQARLLAERVSGKSLSSYFVPHQIWSSGLVNGATTKDQRSGLCCFTGLKKLQHRKSAICNGFSDWLFYLPWVRSFRQHLRKVRFLVAFFPNCAMSVDHGIVGWGQAYHEDCGSEVDLSHFKVDLMLLFCAVFRIWTQNSRLQCVRFSNRCLHIAFTLNDFGQKFHVRRQNQH